MRDFQNLIPALLLMIANLSAQTFAAEKGLAKNFAPINNPPMVSGTVGFVETEGYYPAVIFEGKASESIYNSLSVAPYQSNDGTWVKAGSHIVCAKASKQEGLDEVIIYQCFESISPSGRTHPGYIKRPPPGSPPPDDDECRKFRD